MENYYRKYLKYKMKYINLSKMSKMSGGGEVKINIINRVSRDFNTYHNVPLPDAKIRNNRKSTIGIS